ncbi:uncharacterized protein K452DRAFT_231087 [Aplosporella prunicola CBS 121167]|uniref:Thymidylate kinase n=1 Tax=Aplosporella prunicola CBS 121167 TaxID=1176127 RepID=A0A6A6BAG9_9PEZI|nr:uncharacterized protein K452DRAFT_231087 [Aplosporella prunicola CBS 121167]KAF2140353.1 hypothetical protein K452DRAFT_231087 [Aplosporella prunicola CBS 121167]
MTAHLPARQPFAALDCPRLHSLASTKNRQNSIPASIAYSSAPGKLSSTSPSKRRHTTSSFDDEYDGENVDPASLNSSTKRSKAPDGSPKKASKLPLTDAIKPASSSPRLACPSTQSLSSNIQKSKKQSTPTKSSISTSRGSPKHKRVGLLSKRRTAGSSVTRIDPPSLGSGSRQSSSLPFSIDAALSGSVSSHPPAPKVEEPKPATSELNIPTLDEAMPKGWFFEIHEDSPEEEATNMMEHSAGVLDISSDDDSDAKAQNEAREKGKENIPPPDHYQASVSAQSTSGRRGTAASAEAQLEPLKLSKLSRKQNRDDMEEDRSPLSDLLTSDYFGEGLDANSYVIVDGTTPEKPSSLSKECIFDDDETADETARVPADSTSSKAGSDEARPHASPAAAKQHEEITIFEDEANAAPQVDDKEGAAARA